MQTDRDALVRTSKEPVSGKKNNSGRSKTPQGSTKSWPGGIIVVFLLAAGVSAVSDDRWVILITPDYSKQF